MRGMGENKITESFHPVKVNVDKLTIVQRPFNLSNVKMVSIFIPFIQKIIFRTRFSVMNETLTPERHIRSSFASSSLFIVLMVSDASGSGIETCQSKYTLTQIYT